VFRFPEKQNFSKIPLPKGKSYKLPTRKECRHQRRSAAVLTYRKLRKIDLAVSHCFDTNEAWIGKQPPAGVARFFIYYTTMLSTFQVWRFESVHSFGFVGVL
jgi:hypothetical protein